MRSPRARASSPRARRRAVSSSRPRARGGELVLERSLLVAQELAARRPPRPRHRHRRRRDAGAPSTRPARDTGELAGGRALRRVQLGASTRGRRRPLLGEAAIAKLCEQHEAPGSRARACGRRGADQRAARAPRAPPPRGAVREEHPRRCSAAAARRFGGRRVRHGTRRRPSHVNARRRFDREDLHGRRERRPGSPGEAIAGSSKRATSPSRFTNKGARFWTRQVFAEAPTEVCWTRLLQTATVRRDRVENGGVASRARR